MWRISIFICRMYLPVRVTREREGAQWRDEFFILTRILISILFAGLPNGHGTNYCRGHYTEACVDYSDWLWGPRGAAWVLPGHLLRALLSLLHVLLRQGECCKSLKNYHYALLKFTKNVPSRKRIRLHRAILRDELAMLNTFSNLDMCSSSHVLCSTNVLLRNSVNSLYRFLWSTLTMWKFINHCYSIYPLML